MAIRAGAVRSRRGTRRLRLIRKTLTQVDDNDHRKPSDLRRAAADVILLSRFYYVFIVFAISSGILRFDGAYKGRPPTTPVWPIELLERLAGAGWLANTTALSSVGLSVALLAAVFPRVPLWRLGVFLYLMLHIALGNSYGSINHGRYYYLYVSFALLFLPGRDKTDKISRRNILSCLAVLWLTQSLLLLPYSLAGWWKIQTSGFELFSSDGMVRILLDRVVEDADDIPPLLPFVVEHEYLAQAMLLVTVYLQLIALLVVFRPHLHRPFGIAIVLFHIGSDWVLGIPFAANIFMMSLFLVLSPTAPARTSLLGIMQSLPILGIPIRARIRLRSSSDHERVDQAWLVYDGECLLCRNYTQYLRVKESVNELVLVDAREGGPLVEEIRGLPYDLDEGMVLKMNGRYYRGHEALNCLAFLSENRGGFSRVNRLVFNSPLAARLGYPLLKLARRLLLRIKGVQPLA